MKKTYITTKKILLFALRALITLAAFGAAAYVLYRFEYFRAFGAVDNAVGMLPVAFALIFAGGVTATAWMRHTKRFAPLSVTLALFVILSAALYPVALTGNWWINSRAAEGTEARSDLTEYAPFTGAKTARLDGISGLKLDGDLPLMDGATALYPVYAAFCEAVCGGAAFTEGKVLCTGTGAAYAAIIKGERDVIFAAGASEQQLAAAAAAGVNLAFTPIGAEAFVFLAGKKNPVDNITYQQIRNIYSGKTARWSTLGWREGGNIIAFQRPEGSGSQTGLQNIMKESKEDKVKSLPVQAPQPLPDAGLIGTNSLMRQVSVEWQGVQPAIGYSYRYYAATMYANPDAKMLKVQGIEPSLENIQNGSYPFVADFYAVTNGEPEGNVKLLIEWILSPQGQEIIEKTGYTPIR